MISVVSGKLGSGKSYWCVSRIRKHVKAGGIVVTNLDIDFDALRLSLRPRIVRPGQIIRVDAAADPRLIPRGDFRGTRGGARRVMVVLDEALNWFASSAGATKDEKKLVWLEWLRQSDKLGQDVYFVAQNFERAAKWIRELAQVCHHVVNFGQISFWNMPVGRWLHLRRCFVVYSVDMGTHTSAGLEFGFLNSVVWSCYNTAQLWGFSASGNAYDGVALFPAWKPPLLAWKCVCALLLWGMIRYALAS